MFNLDDELTRWRQSMTAAGLKSPEVIGELEDHLRDDIQRQMRSGISASDAFRSAVERLGGPSALRTEFDLVQPAGVRAMLRLHRWKIFLCSAAGVFAALIVYVLQPAMYISEAKLLIRAIIIADPPMGTPLEQRVGLPDERVLNPLMREEVELLSSIDLASRVVRNVGQEQILRDAGGGSDRDKALAVVRNGLLVQQVASGSAVIRLTFRHPDPTIVQPVLREVIENYLRMHVEKHRASGEQSFVVGRISNISSVKAPSQPLFDSVSVYRQMAMMVAAGVVGGAVWALLAACLSHLARHQRGVG